MNRIDTWMQRFRNIGQKKAHERLLTGTSKFEVMTSTQAVRFKKLKRIGASAKKETRGDSRSKPHCSLPEACRTLGVSVNRILQAAASKRLTCYVIASDLRGSFEGEGADDSGKNIATPEYLALTPADCQRIETWGSVNVHELEDPTDSADDNATASPRFRLLEPLWIDSERVVLKQPLPDCFAT